MSLEDRLDGTAFAQLLRAGHARLKQHVDVVNALNVFPVPDGDTGTNMELSLASGVARLAERDEWPLGSAAQALAAGLLMGARGNSGVILSQLFRGFLKVTQRVDALDIETFAAALQEGVQIAYRAVSKPVEGTMLTVAREAAAAGVREARHATSFAAWMASVYDAAKTALERTPEQLAVLKEAGVVDSGGQGLVYIYEGFLAWLQGDVAVDTPVETARHAAAPRNDALDFAAAQIDHDGEYGYCTEVLVRVAEMSTEDAERQLRERLGTYGDSLLVVGADDLVKVHVHTLHPGRVLEDAIALGPLVKIKIDNMTEQHADIRGTAEPLHPEASAEGKTDGKAAGKAVAIVAVAAGEGLQRVFASLGADVVIAGGQTMNPSTEDIVEAVRSTASVETIVLPNNKNIVMAANQAREVLGRHVHVVPTTSIPEGIAALMSFHPEDSVADNTRRMTEAIRRVHAGQVVRAVRDSVYQDRAIKANQFLGLVNQELMDVQDDRLAVAMNVIRAMGGMDAELLTVFYGSGVPEEEVNQLCEDVQQTFGLEVERQYGGQPVYDYIFALE
ncbi:DAK2 domain-containing protein [Alicyclobacillus cycloheptanicus]|uniref:DAK2 domain fusion protein YloV n=1 Tax=Alicyclobacillus cycloheptanicus TaxID=1457 RepID=A0ABT9XM90_9BACL|nr:DAK2 domain-containing protein [Alicyclobacillus cycloheptanicus]MDQ0190848.1 DAK2 domain fusion protein YloV [Alicyclobacillus cycloheptanicus]WDM01454.1 DAK2 domain-containing protein [Alicyclobacillus cycloheptanicus]